MKIKVKVSDLNEAIARVKIVTPKARNSNKDTQSAYLITLANGVCHIHSQGENSYVRTEVPLLEHTEDGSFAYPIDRVEALNYMEGSIEFEAGETDTDDGSQFWVNYKTEAGAVAKRVTYDPRLLDTMEDALGEASTELEYSTNLLREGFSSCSKCLGDQEDDTKPHKIIQIFDASDPAWAKGDGVMYAADGQRACYFYSPSLVGKGLSIHEKHVSHLMGFLGKCGKTVKVKIGSTKIFAIDQISNVDGTFKDGSVFGWAKHATKHSRYAYHSDKLNKFVLTVDAAPVLRALKQIRSELKSTKRDRIRVIYRDSSLKFRGTNAEEFAETSPVKVEPKLLEDSVDSGNEFEANINVNHMIGLFESAKVNRLDLQVGFKDAQALRDGQAVFRTVDRFELNDSGKVVIAPAEGEKNFECVVTYLAVSMK